VKLVWTYSDRFKKGRENKISEASHEYIQFLFRKSIKEAPSVYEKYIYTDEYNFKIFEDLDVNLIKAREKEFIFLDDLKMDAADAVDGEFIIIDGDLFLKNELIIPSNKKIGFEVKVDSLPTLQQKIILQKEGIVNQSKYWDGDNQSINNVGLIYFNDDKLKADIVGEYRKLQKFFVDKIDKKYKINENEILFSSVACCMLTYQYLEYINEKPFYFLPDNDGNFEHLGFARKFKYLKEFQNKSSLI